jgi:pSer/pThr/pTyr-binding forkhead associated (FHA) protein
VLVVDQTNERYALRPGSNVVGRGSEADLQLMDQGVSRRHVDIQFDGARATVYDLGSTNGTNVNGHEVATCCVTATCSGSATRASCSTRSTSDDPPAGHVNSALALQLMRFGFLALLWLFVFAAIRVIRGDLRAAGQPRVSTPPPARRKGAKATPQTSARGPSQLIVTEGGLSGTRIGLTGAPVLIGRANDSTLVLTDDYASTRHARISQQDGMWVVEDLGSTNGTYLGQRKLDGPAQMDVGVPLRIGKTVLELR